MFDSVRFHVCVRSLRAAEHSVFLPRLLASRRYSTWVVCSAFDFSVVLAAGWTPWPLTTHCQGRQVHCTFYRLERLHMLKIEKNKDVEGETVSDSHRGSSPICGDSIRRYHIVTTAFPTTDFGSSVQKEHHGYALSWKQMPHIADIQSPRRRRR